MGLNAHEFDVYVNQIGMTPLAALQSGTINAADLLGMEGQDGCARSRQVGGHYRGERRSAQGHYDAQTVPFVMKSGVVYKNETGKSETAAK